MKFSFSFGNRESNKESFETLRVGDDSIKIHRADFAQIETLKNGVTMAGWTVADNNLLQQIIERATHLYEERGEDFPSDYEAVLRRYISSTNV